MERIIADETELAAFAKEYAASLTPRERATVVTLSGELGAGKTAFTKALAAALGVTEHITSPTFVLEKIYALPQGPFARLVHVDAYRLKNSSELSALGFDALLEDPENLIVLEWPERVEDMVPTAERISITMRDDGSRSITYA